MSNEKSSKGEVLKVKLKQFNADDLRRIIALQQREIHGKNERLKGVEDLTRLLNESEEKRQNLQTKLENYENALKRGEARIAYLQKKLGIGPQSTFGIDVVSPGISRKDFDAVTKENIRLKEALEHIVPTELGGKDIAIKNKELYDLVSTLRDDLAQSEHHIKELEETLAAKQDDLIAKVSQLTKQNITLERSLQAKQVFSEKLMKENTRLQQKKLVVLDRDVPDGQAIEDKINVNENTTATTNARSNKEQEKIVEEKDKVIAKQLAKIQELLAKNEESSKRISELSTEVVKINEAKQKAEHELTETSKKCSDFQKKCAGFFNQVVSLNSKQQESEEEISSLKRACENLRAQLAEKEAMMVMMRDSLKTYEDDFRRENEEKAGIQKRMESTKQENERLKRENNSNMSTISNFEREIERMSNLLTDEQKRYKTPTSFQTGFGQPFGTSTSKSLFQNRPPLLVADGTGGINESSTTSRQGSAAKSSPTLIECPYCSRSYPYHLIEGHVQDCMEDSLYMDN